MAKQIAIDTTVTIAVITNESSKPRLVELTRQAELIAPASMPWEIGNALSAMFKQRRITIENALAALSAYEQIVIQLVEVPLPQAVQVSSDLGIYAYDAYMICCALNSGAPLLTLDQRLKASAARAGVMVLEV